MGRGGEVEAQPRVAAGVKGGGRQSLSLKVGCSTDYIMTEQP